MRFFLNFINEFKDVKNLIERCSELEGHQGTTIRFSDTFLLLHSVIKKANPDYIKDILYDFQGFRRGYYRGRFFRYFDEFNHPADAEGIDFREVSDFKSAITPDMDKSFYNPIEIVISVFNDTNMEQFEQLAKEYSYNENFNLIIEKRERSTFLNSKKAHTPLLGGISIGQDNPTGFGTLGGFLKDSEGKKYGITCSHVIGGSGASVFQPARYDSSKSREIGNTAFSSELNFCAMHDACNSGTESNMDVALIEINEEACESAILDLGRVYNHKQLNDMYQGMKVEYNGRTANKKKRLVLGGLTVSYKVAYDTSDGVVYACFNNLIELRNKPLRFFGLNFYIGQSPVSAGDSGSWICSDDSTGYSWCGMLISGDLDRGFFLPSDHILQYLSDNGHNLTL